MPPCFARAVVTSLAGRSTLLIAGTASVVGEDSRHPGDMVAQLDETLRNIGATVDAAPGTAVPTAVDPLARLVDLRAYATTDEVAHHVRQRLRVCCPNARRSRASCSGVPAELLLEIRLALG